MAHQKLFIDERQQAHHFIHARLGHLDVECAGQVQRLEILHPGKRDVIVSPVARDRDRDFIIASPLERPVV